VVGLGRYNFFSSDCPRINSLPQISSYVKANLKYISTHQFPTITGTKRDLAVTLNTSLVHVTR